jgi:SAM-dependent methyltransferase
MSDGGQHWGSVYSTRSTETLSWFQKDPVLSRTLIEQFVAPPAPVIDVGAGDAYLADQLLARGYKVGLLDISGEALKTVRQRLGTDADQVEWFVADVTRFRSPHVWAVWHDRAVFHFLISAEERMAYREALDVATGPGSVVIIATFGPEGPDRCSGLATARYSPEQLAAEVGPRYQLKRVDWEVHTTPAAAAQQFVYCCFERAK